MARFISTSCITKQTVTGVIGQWCGIAFGTWAIFPQLREINLNIDLDVSHYLYISAGAAVQ